MISALCSVSLTRLCWRFWRRYVKLYSTEMIARTCEKGSVVLVISLWCERLRRSNKAPYLLSSVRQRTLAPRWRRPGTQDPAAPDVQESACTFGVASSQLAWTEGSREPRKGTASWTRETFGSLSGRCGFFFYHILKCLVSWFGFFSWLRRKKISKTLFVSVVMTSAKLTLDLGGETKTKSFKFLLPILLFFLFGDNINLQILDSVQWFHHRPQTHAWLQLLHIILYIYIIQYITK